MAEFTEWQTGVVIAVGSLVGGGAVAVGLGSAIGTAGTYVGFVAGAVAAFLLLSYVLYGR